MSGRQHSSKARLGRRRGSAIVEFSLVAFMTLIVVLGVVEMGRMILVYTDVANAARAGARYAIVHGNMRTGTGVDGPSGPADNPTQVVTVVTNFASAAPLDTSRLVVTVTYPSGSNSVGSPVKVTAVYPYDPFVSYLPLRVKLGSTSHGIITF
jgi:Flp pilus assembly protein TadG